MRSLGGNIKILQHFSPLYIQATQRDKIYLQNLVNDILLLELKKKYIDNQIIKHLGYFPQ